VAGWVFGRAGSPGELRVERQAEPVPEGFSPIAGALVTCTGTSEVTLSTADGGFLLSRVAAGEQRVTVTAEGYATIEVPVLVEEGREARVGSLALWTLMVYMDGDNDLEPYAIDDFNEMECLPRSFDVNIVVQFDRHPAYDRSNGDWSETRRYKVEPDADGVKVSSPVLENMGEVDMADPAELSAFIGWAAENYPAKHYALVLWNHGSGWLAAQRRPPTRAIIYDFTSGSAMSMPELESGLDWGGPALDLICFDACNMALIEVAEACKHSALLMQASEETVPASGMPYHYVWQPLFRQPTMSAEELADTMAHVYWSYYASWFGLTASVFDLSRTDEVTAAISDFGDALAAVWATRATEISEAAELAQDYTLRDLRDLRHFTELVAARVPEVASPATALGAALDRAVLSDYASGEVADSRGVAIYLPLPASAYDATYDETQFAKNSRWDEFLRLATEG